MHSPLYQIVCKANEHDPDTPYAGYLFVTRSPVTCNYTQYPCSHIHSESIQQQGSDTNLFQGFIMKDVVVEAFSRGVDRNQRWSCRIEVPRGSWCITSVFWLVQWIIVDTIWQIVLVVALFGWWDDIQTSVGSWCRHYIWRSGDDVLLGQAQKADPVIR